MAKNEMEVVVVVSNKMYRREKSLRIFRQFTRSRLLRQNDDGMEVETKIMLKLANELMKEYADTITSSSSSSMSWENTKLHAAAVCTEIYAAGIYNWGRTITACVYALESIRDHFAEDEYNINEIAEWLYDDIVNTSWMEKRGWDEFIRIFEEKEKAANEEKNKNILLISILIYLPVSITFIVLYSLFK